MKFKLEFDIPQAHFPTTDFIVDRLYGTAGKILDSLETSGIVRDVNGNTIGKYGLVPDGE